MATQNRTDPVQTNFTVAPSREAQQPLLAGASADVRVTSLDSYANARDDGRDNYTMTLTAVPTSTGASLAIHSCTSATMASNFSSWLR